MVSFLNEIDIVEARVTDVMTRSSQNVTQHVPRVQMTLRFQAALGADKVECLCQVCCVRFVVVGYINVCLLNFFDKVKELFIFYWQPIKKLFFCKEMTNDCHQFIIVRLIFNLEDVEVQGVNFC